MFKYIKKGFSLIEILLVISLILIILGASFYAYKNVKVQRDAEQINKISTTIILESARLLKGNKFASYDREKYENNIMDYIMKDLPIKRADIGWGAPVDNLGTFYILNLFESSKDDIQLSITTKDLDTCILSLRRIYNADFLYGIADSEGNFYVTKSKNLKKYNGSDFYNIKVIEPSDISKICTPDENYHRYTLTSRI